MLWRNKTTNMEVHSEKLASGVEYLEEGEGEREGERERGRERSERERERVSMMSE